jgi:crotonobetainyl-CoA:carnitine CoA-transferase CaiB-like acyl-CoA transferase
MLTPAEALAHPQATSRGVVLHSGHVTEVGPLAQISGHTLQPAPAPRAGQHTRALLGELGLPPSEIDALLADGIVKETA